MNQLFLTVGLISHFILLLIGIYILIKKNTKSQTKIESIIGISSTSIIFILFSLTLIGSIALTEGHFKTMFKGIAALFGIVSAVYNFTDEKGKLLPSHILSITLVGLAIGLNIWIEKIEAKTKIESEEKASKGFSKNIDELKNMSSKMTYDDSIQFEKLVNEIKYTKNSSDYIAGYINATKDSVGEVRKDLFETNENVEILQDSLDKNLIYIAKTNKGINSVEDSVISAMSKIKSTNESISTVQNQLNTTLSEVGNIKTELLENEDNIENLKSTVENANTKVEDIANNMSTLVQELNAIKTSRTHLLRLFIDAIRNDTIQIDQQKYAVIELQNLSDTELEQKINHQ